MEAIEGPKSADKVISESQFAEKMKVAYPMAQEDLIDFLSRCRLKNSKVMICPICSYVFDKEATKGLESFIPKSKKRGKWSADHRLKFSFTSSYIPFMSNSSTTNYVNKNGQDKTFVHHAKAPVQKWVHSTHKNVQYAYSNNYKGKNPMKRTRWRSYQRSKKDVAADPDDKAVDPKGKQKVVEIAKRSVKERYEIDSDFTDSEPDFDVVCNVVSILPAEYDVVSEVEESEDDFNPEDREKYRPM